MSHQQEIYKVTLIGSAANIALLILKFIAAIIANSSAMMADALHSLSDLLTDIVVLLFIHLSAKPQDHTHNYGHGKFETFATFIIGLLLAAAAITIAATATHKVILSANGTQQQPPGLLALWAALISILIKETLYHYTLAQGHKLKSQATIANAWHHRSDALSSIAAAIGITAAITLGKQWTILDPIASIVVAAMLLKVAYKLIKTSTDELTERSLPKNIEQEINNIISSVPGITQPHNLRTRRIGNSIAIETHIRMDRNTPLHLAHERATTIEQKLKQRFGQSTHVSIHMEPIK